MNCPACGSAGAYVGLSVVECASAACQHFKLPGGPAGDPFADDESTYDNRLYADGGPLAGFKRGGITEEILRIASSEMEKAIRETDRVIRQFQWWDPKPTEFVRSPAFDLNIVVPGEYRYIPMYLYAPLLSGKPRQNVVIDLDEDDRECGYECCADQED